uniref:F-box associated beta-propeller type 1 domain-containing protein n=1 Tax=Fagus sylvatica TaxID=28930 RepID=A0A2N9FET8_FAGSY
MTGTLTNLSKFETPFCYARIVSFCNGIYLCDSYYYNNVLYLWNPSIGKFKKLVTTSTGGVHGFAYDSQNNDFKILRMGAEVAEVYTLSTDSWRKVVISESLSESIDYIYLSSLFFNGALHSIARSGSCHFILAFDINDEIFRKIMLPQNDNFGGIGQSGLTSEWLAVLKGSLALIVISDHTPWDRNTCHISVMREYGVVESWTTKTVPLYFTQGFFGCTDNGELLIQFFESHPISFDPENLNEYLLGIEASHWLSYTAYLMESLVLLDQHNEAEMEPDIPLCPREATNTSSDAHLLRAKYPSLPSWEVKVMNDFGEGETMIVPRLNHDRYEHAWMGGPFEADFVEECYSLIKSMKNWIWSSSQSSFARQNKLSHEIDLLHNRVESQANTIRTLERCLWSFGPREAGGSRDPWIQSSSQSSVAYQNNPSHEIDLLRNKIESQASTIRTLERCLWSLGPREAGGSSDLVPDAADGVNPSPGDEGNPMNLKMKSKEGSA